VSDLDSRLKGGEIGWFSRLVYHTLHFIVAVLVLVYFRARVVNPKKLPPRGAVILAPVHRSNLDVPLLGATCPRRLRYFAKDTLFEKRFWRWLLTTVGGFPVRRDATDRQAVDAARRVLDRGEALAMFPEGERKSGPVLHELFNGVAYMAAKAQATIVPVGIGGSERAMPKGAKIPRPTKITFIYGDPIPPPAVDGKRVDRSDIRRVTAELHTAVQTLFDEAQDAVGAPHAVPAGTEPTPG